MPWADRVPSAGRWGAWRVVRGDRAMVAENRLVHLGSPADAQWAELPPETRVVEAVPSDGTDVDVPTDVAADAVVVVRLDGSTRGGGGTGSGSDGTDRSNGRSRRDDRLDPVVDHLIENAVVHADTDTPRVSIDAAIDPDRGAVTIRVADDGPGIPEAIREVISGDAPITQLRHNSGIGLWIVAWVVEAYGGTVGFEPGIDGEGTTVRLRLPAAGPPAADVPPSDGPSPKESAPGGPPPEESAPDGPSPDGSASE